MPDLDSITVPGLLSAWEQIAQLGGSMDFADLLAHAIRAAADGVVVSPSLAAGIRWRRDILLQNKGIADLFVPNGKPLATGDLLKQPALQATLETIAADGVVSFYEGSVGEKLDPRIERPGVVINNGRFSCPPNTDQRSLVFGLRGLRPRGS